MAVAVAVSSIPASIVAATVPRRPRAPDWPEWIERIAYLVERAEWTLQEIAVVSLLEVIAPPHIQETIAALRERATRRHGDALFAPPSERERELAKRTGLGGVDPFVWQIFQDEQRRPGITRGGSRQGGRKRRKKPKPVRAQSRWKWEEKRAPRGGGQR